MNSDGGGVVLMAVEENGFLEYLQLQGSDPDLVTKSELLAAVRERGFSIGERQLSFYVSEGIMPKSVRVGSRAGAYPRIVVELLAWVLRARDGGLPIDTIRELLPVWKLLIRARRDQLLDLAELEYVSRQHVTSMEGAMAIPVTVADVLHTCEKCLRGTDHHVVAVMKDGTKRDLADTETTLGFAIARRMDVDSDQSDDAAPRSSWFARTRISLAASTNAATDPTTVILGLKPNEALPTDASEEQVADAQSALSGSEGDGATG